MTTQSFRFVVAETADGKEFVACSTQEPAFCFVRNSEQEAIRVAEETFAEYRSLFLKKEAPLRARALPVLPAIRLSSERTYELQEA